MTQELKAGIRNKLQSLKTLVEHLRQGKEVPRDFVEMAAKHMSEIEELIEVLLGDLFECFYKVKNIKKCNGRNLFG